MVYAIIENTAALTGTKYITFHKYNNISEMIRKPFPPDSITLWLIDTKAAPHGKTYKRKKRTLLYKAFNFQYNLTAFDGGKNLIPESDLKAIKEYFYRHGKKYGLLKQFKRSSII